MNAFKMFLQKRAFLQEFQQRKGKFFIADYNYNNEKENRHADYHTAAVIVYISTYKRQEKKGYKVSYPFSKDNRDCSADRRLIKFFNQVGFQQLSHLSGSYAHYESRHKYRQ